MNELAATGLAVPEPIDSAHADRIRSILASPSWAWLTVAVRDAWVLDLSRRRVRVDLASLSEPQVAAVADFMAWRTHRAGVVQLDLGRIDRLLRASGLAAGLATCLYESSGPLDDAAGSRRAAEATRREASDRLWSEASRHAVFLAHPALTDWLALERTAGRLPSEPDVRRSALFASLDVLGHLPHPGIGLAQLATQVLGHAHALDSGAVPATVLRGLAWLAEVRDVPAGAEGRRALWAQFGIALDTVSSTVLVFGLRLLGDGPIATTLGVNAAAGIPVRLTLGQVQHYLRGQVGGPPIVWVCENPSVVEEAADKIGVGCAPLISVEGRPSVAVLLLLRALRRSGCDLRYHGDFDWAGLAIASSIFELGATPWRMSAADYLSALDRIRLRLPSLGTAPLGETSSWDPLLANEMRQHGSQIEEEHVVNDLLADLVMPSKGTGRPVTGPASSLSSGSSC